jgi:hypothetical protein
MAQVLPKGTEEALNPQPLPPGYAINVYVTTEIANDLESMNKVTANIMRKLGCGGCHSGRLLHFKTLEDYVVDPATLDVHAVTPQQFRG